jgi:transposase
VTDARGVPLVAHVTAANANDITHLDARGIVAILGRRRTFHGSGLGVFRWVVERTLAWLRRFRRLAVRYERHDRVHHAFLTLGCALICWNYLKSTGRVF